MTCRVIGVNACQDVLRQRGWKLSGVTESTCAASVLGRNISPA